MLRKIVLALIIAVVPLCWSVQHCHAQEADYYRMEVGGGVGMWNYLGDFNGNLTRGFQPQASALWKYLPNERMAFKVDFSLGSIKGKAADAKGYLPEKWKDYEFKTSLYDLSAMFEYNFWRHGMDGDYRHLHRLVPYITLGIGATYFSSTDMKKAAFSFPIGFGGKYKIAERLNLGLEWIMHFTTSDEIDVAKDPYGIPSTGMFKNTDGFGQLKLYITYSFMAKCRQCNN